MKIYSNILELIGRTPLVSLNNFSKEANLETPLIAKLESFNPAGSAKDRVAAEIIAQAEKEGKLKKGSVIIEPTSGNTGIGIAAIAASKGYKAVIIMPDSMSAERCALVKAYGAELILTPGALGMNGAIEKANELLKEYDNAIIAGQFTNEANPMAHKKTTGPEIWEDIDGKVDIFIAGVGTGGTITGVGEYLKEKNPEIKIIAVEPKNSPFLSEGKAGSHGLQGIGAGFIPEILNTKIYDEIITVLEEDAYNMGNLLSKTEGYLVGISSGAALFAACQIAKRPENQNKNIVVLLPDTGERYLSTPMFI